MAENSLNTTAKIKKRRDLGKWLRSNPVLVREMRTQMRGFRAFLLLTIYLLIQAVVVSIIYWGMTFTLKTGLSYSVTSDQIQSFGKTIFGLVIGLELLGITFIAPALAAGAVSSERENLTFDLLRTTALPVRSFILGKFYSSIIFLFLLLISALPLLSLTFFFGGIGPEEVAISMLILMVTAIFYFSAGIFCSSIFKRTLPSTVLSYAFSILHEFGLVILLLITLIPLRMDASILTNNTLSLTIRNLIILVGWVLLSTNPVGTLVATEVLLIQEHTAFLYQFPVDNGVYLLVVSPWIFYLIIHLFLSVCFLFLSIKITQRPAK